MARRCRAATDSRGTIFRMTLAGAVTSLYSFPSLSAFSTAGVATNATGANPRAGLMLAADGNFYGTAYQGGPIGYGTVFRVTPAGGVTVVHAFTGPTTGGAFPLASVSQDAAGNLYGTTERGGALNQGSAWRINTSGQFSLLHGFTSSIIDGAHPVRDAAATEWLPLWRHQSPTPTPRLAPCSSSTWATA